jgi:DHA2 family methylenomycin A resistance protein-like MFS transporter
MEVFSLRFSGDQRNPAQARKHWTLAIMCLGVLIAQIDTSIVNLMLRPLGIGLQASVSELQWVVDAYNLTYACLLLTGGALGDLYGRRRIFLFGMLTFTAGSVICGLAPTSSVLIGGRAITGLGAAFELPVSLAIIANVFADPAERAKAIGIWAGCNGLALAIGPTFGGLLVEGLGWRSAFLVVVPVGLLASIGALKVVPESAHAQSRKIDVPGQIAAMVALASLSFAVIRGGESGWSAPLVQYLLVASAAASLVFLLVESAAGDAALIPLAFFRTRAFSAAIVAALLMTFGMYGMLFLVPLYLQEVRGIGTFAAGLDLLPMSVVFFFVSRYSGQFASAAGAKLVMSAGMSLMAGGLLILSFVVSTFPLWLIELALCLIGAGLGLNAGPVMAVAVANVPAHRAGIASGVGNTARIIGATLGVAVAGTVLAIYAGQEVALHAVPTGNLANLLSGLRAAFRVGAAGEAFGALIVLLFIRQSALHITQTSPTNRAAEPAEGGAGAR